ncbi:MAG: hypothetical protein R3F20_06370 [Planctomycetota bacterium]
MALLLANFALAAFHCGLIWTIQVVHYPLLRRVPAEDFPAYHAAHTRAITWIVAPTMTSELVLALWLAHRDRDLDSRVVWAAALVVIVWAATIVFQVPQHARLARGRDEATLRALVRTNLIRTAAWTARAALLGALLLER